MAAGGKGQFASGIQMGETTLTLTDVLYPCTCRKPQVDSVVIKSEHMKLEVD